VCASDRIHLIKNYIFGSQLYFINNNHYRMSSTKHEPKKIGSGLGKGKGMERLRGEKVKRHALNHNSMKRINRASLANLKEKDKLEDVNDDDVPKFVSHEILHEVKQVLKEYLEKILRNAVHLVDHDQRSTVMFEDINLALKNNGIHLYSDVFTKGKDTAFGKKPKKESATNDEEPVGEDPVEGNDEEQVAEQGESNVTEQ
jgi:histone H3/H4